MPEQTTKQNILAVLQTKRRWVADFYLSFQTGVFNLPLYRAISALESERRIQCENRSAPPYGHILYCRAIR